MDVGDDAMTDTLFWNIGILLLAIAAFVILWIS